jgi:hypothetical protein
MAIPSKLHERPADQGRRVIESVSVREAADL